MQVFSIHLFSFLSLKRNNDGRLQLFDVLYNSYKYEYEYESLSSKDSYFILTCVMHWSYSLDYAFSSSWNIKKAFVIVFLSCTSFSLSSNCYWNLWKSIINLYLYASQRCWSMKMLSHVECIGQNWAATSRGG